jgi:CheY-like chemotaxis protein
MNVQKKKVLVVDDDYSSRRLLMKIVKDIVNCEILQAEDGSEALRSMIKNNPDLVILDMIMPFMNGVQVLKTMKQNANLKKIPVIACTAVGDDSAVKQIIKMGVASYIIKPVTKESLVQKLTEILIN